MTRFDVKKSLVQRQYEHREAYYYYYGLYRECAASKVAKCIGVTVAKALQLVSKELNHFGVIAGLFRQIGGNSSRFVLF